jgi:hypothetical protein
MNGGLAEFASHCDGSNADVLYETGLNETLHVWLVDDLSTVAFSTYWIWKHLASGSLQRCKNCTERATVES